MIIDTPRSTSAHVGLREATHALCLAARARRPAALPDEQCQSLAGDLAEALDALEALLRCAGLAARPTSSTVTHSLRAVTQQLSVTASPARRAAGDDLAGAQRAVRDRIGPAAEEVTGRR